MAAGLAVMVERKRLTRDIRSEARRLGFAATGIARVEPLPAAQRLDAWLAGGMHGAMAYMGRQAERRKNPALVLENARSLLVLGFSYHTDDLFKEEPLKGRISRYAWGGDYHELIRPRLERLREFILSRAPGTRGVSYVDTGPVMEKAWGAASSLGWIGRHSNLVSREMGSWFFIGVVLLDLELEYDSPARDYCGSCARCIPACPTSAIVAPYVVDARLCISYLTIEFRGIIPPALRPLMGNRIFGCDDCLEVCPWNRFARPTAEAQFRPRKDLLMPELTSLVNISARDFSVRFRHSAVRRAHREGFVRNVVLALGNSRDARALPALRSALRDESPLVRAHAAWALGRIPHSESRGALAAAAAIERERDVRNEIEKAQADLRAAGVQT